MGVEIPLVLCVDDNNVAILAESIRESFDGPVNVLEATTRAAAEQFIEEYRNSIDVMIVDVYLDGMNPTGLDLGREVVDHIPTILISAHPLGDFDDNLIGLAPIAFHDKPIQIENLLNQIEVGLWLKQYSQTIATPNHKLQTPGIRKVDSTLLCVRFDLRPVDVSRATHPVQTPWDFPRLHLGFEFLDNLVMRERGRINHIIGQTAIATFPGFGFTENHLESAMIVLKALNEAILGLRMERHLYCPSFCASVVPGTLVTGGFGDLNPAQQAIVGRLPDIAQQLLLAAHPGEVATVPQFLSSTQLAELESIGEVREERLSVTGINDSLSVQFLTL